MLLSDVLKTPFKGSLNLGCTNFSHVYKDVGARGGVVVEALRYKPEGHGIDSRWFYWIFSLT
jgi:hypothetical protein